MVEGNSLLGDLPHVTIFSVKLHSHTPGADIADVTKLTHYTILGCLKQLSQYDESRLPPYVAISGCVHLLLEVQVDDPGAEVPPVVHVDLPRLDLEEHLRSATVAALAERINTALRNPSLATDTANVYTTPVVLQEDVGGERGGPSHAHDAPMGQFEQSDAPQQLQVVVRSSERALRLVLCQGGQVQQEVQARTTPVGQGYVVAPMPQGATSRLRTGIAWLHVLPVRPTPAVPRLQLPAMWPEPVPPVPQHTEEMEPQAPFASVPLLVLRRGAAAEMVQYFEALSAEAASAMNEGPDSPAVRCSAFHRSFRPLVMAFGRALSQPAAVPLPVLTRLSGVLLRAAMWHCAEQLVNTLTAAGLPIVGLPEGAGGSITAGQLHDMVAAAQVVARQRRRSRSPRGRRRRPRSPQRAAADGAVLRARPRPIARSAAWHAVIGFPDPAVEERYVAHRAAQRRASRLWYLHLMIAQAVLVLLAHRLATAQGTAQVWHLPELVLAAFANLATALAALHARPGWHDRLLAASSSTLGLVLPHLIPSTGTGIGNGPQCGPDSCFMAQGDMPGNGGVASSWENCVALIGVAMLVPAVFQVRLPWHMLRMPFLLWPLMALCLGGASLPTASMALAIAMMLSLAVAFGVEHAARRNFIVLFLAQANRAAERNEEGPNGGGGGGGGGGGVAADGNGGDAAGAGAGGAGGGNAGGGIGVVAAGGHADSFSSASLSGPSTGSTSSGGDWGGLATPGRA